MALRSVLATGSRLATSDVGFALLSRNGFHISGKCYGLGSHSSDNDPDVLHKEKHRNLAGKTKHVLPGMEEGWNEKLASDSEAAVKADRHVDGTETIEDLQNKSVRHICYQHHEEEVFEAPKETSPGKQGKTNPVG